MISLSNLSKSIGTRILFQNVSFNLDKRSRYGLIGANGSGKSTLLKVLAGQEDATSGTFALNKGAQVGYLRQDQHIDADCKVIEFAMRGQQQAYEAMVKKEELLNHEAIPDAHLLAHLEEIIAQHDGYTLKSRTATVLEGLGIESKVHEQPISVLSGGFRLRALLAQLLISNPDLLLLDEPTNHLDIITIRWLEKYLSTFEGCVILISHDRRFLENTCTSILDIDYETITLYSGNYDYFCAKKMLDKEQKETILARQQKDIAHKQAFVDRFRYKASKAKQAQSRLKQIEKIELVEVAQTSRRNPRFDFQQIRPSGKIALTVEHVEKSFGDKTVLKDVSFEVQRGEKVGIIGPNGIGKSTLLKIVTNHVQQDAGTHEFGFETYIEYVAQDHDAELKACSETLQDWLWQFAPGESISAIRGMLGRALFSGDDAEKRVGSLSGGEMVRLMLAKVMLKKPNVLILDEPTNHLDTEAIEALVTSLNAYEGTLIFVSHDRWFVSELASRILELKKEGLNDFKGTFSEYLEKCGDDHLDASKLRKNQPAKQNTSSLETHKKNAEQKSLKKSIEKKLEKVMHEVAEAENKLALMDKDLCETDFINKHNLQELSQLAKQRDELKENIEELMHMWEKLESELHQLNTL